MTKTVAFNNGLVIYIEPDVPSQCELDTAQHLPGLMQMMPTHAARLQSTSWTIHKRPPQSFDTTPFEKPIPEGSMKGMIAVHISEEYQAAYEAWRKSIATSDPDIDDNQPGTFVLTLKSSLDINQIEHADDNTGMVGNNLVCLEYIGCESSSENWYPDHKYTHSKTAFTNDEMEAIFQFLDKNRNLLP